jgi:hypothetical protein
MPAPWLSDTTKNGTLSNLAATLAPGQLVTAEMAWHIVMGQAGFTQIDNWDDLAYCRFNWPLIWPQ